MSLYDYEVKTIRGENTTLSPYKGQVLLIVNTATKCGLAPQFKGLEKLYQEYRDQGFSVLGFPSDQFLNQELAEDSEIAQACEINHGVTFPLFAKIDVNGSDAHPLFKYLTEQAPGLFGSRAIKWNFTKFLIDREERIVHRFAPKDTPAKIESSLLKVLSPSR
ncbi:glutathione peroxidase [Gorillibacterium timonense]|uniref:glutathione peroxidase n=1 Tax=Gorillibacterium timonense TaxID=1689269 RepID=UPI00071CC06C|nr:glutathione peroxidase [Gorillibacterium timonense]